MEQVVADHLLTLAKIRRGELLSSYTFTKAAYGVSDDRVGEVVREMGLNKLAIEQLEQATAIRQVTA